MRSLTASINWSAVWIRPIPTSQHNIPLLDPSAPPPPQGLHRLPGSPSTSRGTSPITTGVPFHARPRFQPSRLNVISTGDNDLFFVFSTVTFTGAPFVSCTWLYNFKYPSFPA